MLDAAAEVFVADITVLRPMPGISMLIALEVAVEVGVNKVRYSISIVVVVILLVTLNVDTAVSNGFKNSEQNTVALNVIFAGGFRKLLATAEYSNVLQS